MFIFIDTSLFLIADQFVSLYLFIFFSILIPINGLNSPIFCEIYIRMQRASILQINSQSVR